MRERGAQGAEEERMALICAGVWHNGALMVKGSKHRLEGVIAKCSSKRKGKLKGSMRDSFRSVVPGDPTRVIWRGTATGPVTCGVRVPVR